MQISVLFFTILREVIGKKEEKVQFAEDEKVTVYDVLKSLSNQYGQSFTDYVYEPKTAVVKGFLQFFINGQSTSALNGLDSQLHEGDVLAIVPPVGGG
jgi:MoaD family protein